MNNNTSSSLSVIIDHIVIPTAPELMHGDRD